MCRIGGRFLIFLFVFIEMLSGGNPSLLDDKLNIGSCWYLPEKNEGFSFGFFCLFVLLLLLTKLKWVFKVLVLKSDFFLATSFQKFVQNSFICLAYEMLKSRRHVHFF